MCGPDLEGGLARLFTEMHSQGNSFPFRSVHFDFCEAYILRVFCHEISPLIVESTLTVISYTMSTSHLQTNTLLNWNCVVWSLACKRSSSTHRVNNTGLGVTRNSLQIPQKEWESIDWNLFHTNLPWGRPFVGQVYRRLYQSLEVRCRPVRCPTSSSDAVQGGSCTSSEEFSPWFSFFGEVHSSQDFWFYYVCLLWFQDLFGKG